MVDLGQISLSVVVLHYDAAEWEAGAKQCAFKSETVIAMERVIRAGLDFRLRSGRCA
jgi:hypothetical protein